MKGSPRFHFFSSDHYVNLLTSARTLFSYFPYKLFFWVLLLCQLAGWDKSEVITFCSKVMLEGLIISWLYWDCIVFSTIFPYALPFSSLTRTSHLLFFRRRKDLRQWQHQSQSHPQWCTCCTRGSWSMFDFLLPGFYIHHCSCCVSRTRKWQNRTTLPRWAHFLAVASERSRQRLETRKVSSLTRIFALV